MNDNLTAGLTATALIILGAQVGIGLSSVADGATTVTVTTPSTVTVTAPPVSSGGGQ